MPSWYLGKIKYSQEQETGGVKQITESFLLDAVSYSDAETRLYELVADSTPEFTVDSITRQKLSDVFTYEDGEIFFKIKTSWDSIDEVKGKTKKIVASVVLNASDIPQAIERLKDEYKSMLIPYEITDINTTSILEVCRYEAKEETPDSNVEEVDVFGNAAPVYPKFGTPIDCANTQVFCSVGNPVSSANMDFEPVVDAYNNIPCVYPFDDSINKAANIASDKAIVWDGKIDNKEDVEIKELGEVVKIINDELYGFTDHLNNFQKRQELKQEQP